MLARDRSDDLQAERALIERARAALSRDRPAHALDALTQHERRFPRGQMREEREALRIHALRASGQEAAATERARTFRRDHPESLMLPAITAGTGERARRTTPAPGQPWWLPSETSAVDGGNR
ncbi:MAG: hypothetical protein IT379_42425 [Deltaproteobacteria bacterium]|nr:hypothetical protein [Deltaproteobacteria bacterium]